MLLWTSQKLLKLNLSNSKIVSEYVIVRLYLSAMYILERYA